MAREFSYLKNKVCMLLPLNKKTKETVTPIPEWYFSVQAISSITEYGSILGRINKRLLAEGYIIKDGKILPPPKNENT